MIFAQIQFNPICWHLFSFHNIKNDNESEKYYLKQQ